MVCKQNECIITLILIAEIAYPSYVAATWHIYLCLLALLVVQGFITMQSTWFIGWVNKIGTLWNLAVVAIFIIWFPVGSINHPKANSNKEVWTEFENGTEWPIGWSTIMGWSRLTIIEISELTVDRLSHGSVHHGGIRCSIPS